MLTSDEILTLRTYALRVMDHGPMRNLLLRATDWMMMFSGGITPGQVIAAMGKWGIKLLHWQVVNLKKLEKDLVVGGEE